jgi:hypothetical protein
MAIKLNIGVCAFTALLASLSTITLAATFHYNAVDGNNAQVFDITLLTNSQNTVTGISGNTYGYAIDGLVPQGTSFASPNVLFPNGQPPTNNLVNRDGITWYTNFPLGSPWDSQYSNAIFRWQYNPFDGDTKLGVYWGGAPEAFNLKINGGLVSPVPEVETYTMMLAGLGTVAVFLRRAKRTE